MLTLARLTLHIDEDDSPDTSYLGEYGNEWREGAIDRKEQGDWRTNEYRYFYPAMSGEETGNLDSPLQDYRRFEALNRGEWAYMGVRVSAQVVVTKDGQNYGTMQTIHSGGLWGIESDSGREYFAEVASDEFAGIRGLLEEFGLSFADADWESLKQGALDDASKKYNVL